MRGPGEKWVTGKSAMREAAGDPRPAPGVSGRLPFLMRAKLALLGFFLFASQAVAEARISPIRIDLDGGRVLASFTLRNAFNHRFSERVDSGLPTSILYRFVLDRDRKRWWDQQLARARWRWWRCTTRSPAPTRSTTSWTTS